MKVKGFEHLDIYRPSEDLADRIWDCVMSWDTFARNAVGMQLVRAADSVGANIAEGTGRGTYKDNAHFARTARGSLNETRHFLRRAYRRRLITKDEIAQLKPLVRELGPRLNAYIRSLARKAKDAPQSNPPK
jgi:four helix bundle protein